jgi:hypothetical protein
MVKPNLRTKTIGTKVSEEEYAQLERAAQAAEKTLGEWSREVILASANGQSSRNEPIDGCTVQAVMAELVALRTILLNVLYKQVNGKGMTEEEMRQLIERADADKLKKAVERLKQVAESRAK